MKPQIKICKFCGKPFTTTSNRKIYCSPECCYQIQRKNITYTKTCPICGNIFNTYFKSQKYCSEACRIYRNNNKHKIKQPHDADLLIATKLTKTSKKKKSDESKKKQAAKATAHKLRMQWQLEAKKAGISYGQFVAQNKLQEIF